MFEPFAQCAIETEYVGRRNALAIRRVGNHNGFLFGLLELLDGLRCDGHVVGYSGCFGVGLCYGHGVAVEVVGIDMVGKFAFFGIVVVDLVEELFVEILPVFKGVFDAEHTGSNVAGYQRCFDGNST